jgi:hypothetical protein
MLRHSFIAFLFIAFAGSYSASAHYLWVTIDGATTERGSTKIYFEESPAVGDGHYLDHFASSAKTWVRTVENIKPKELRTNDKRGPDTRWLEAEIPQAAPRGIECYGKFGVYQYGNTDVLLHYYARHLDVSTHEDLHELARAEQLDLDIVPHDDGSEMEITVLWRGKPAGHRLVYIRGPANYRENLKTDETGSARFRIRGPGLYTLRTSVEEAIAGRDEGNDYSLIRHNATLIIALPLEK